MGIFRNGASRNGPWVAGVQRQNVWVAGVNRLAAPTIRVVSVTTLSSSSFRLVYDINTLGEDVVSSTIAFTTVETNLDTTTPVTNPNTIQNGFFRYTLNFTDRPASTTVYFRIVVTTDGGTAMIDGSGSTAAVGLITWNEAAWTGTRYTGLNTAGNTLTGGSAGNASSRTLTSTESSNAGNARTESVSYSVGRPDATYTPASFTLTHSVTQAAFNAPTPTYTIAQAESNISFAVAQSGVVSLVVTGTLNNANFTNNQNLGVVSSITTRILTGNYVVPSGFTNTGSTVPISISVDQALSQVVSPSARIENADGTTTDATAVRPATIQLTDASTAGTNPITSRVWTSSNPTVVAVNQSGLVTPFGAIAVTITLTVSDAFGNSDSDTHEVSFSNTVFPTIDVTPESLGISGAGGTGTAFTIFTTGTGITVTVTGENAGTLASWLTVSPSGAWSADPNPGAARSATIRFTVRDALFQSAFDEVTVTQAEDQECRMVTLVGGGFYVYNAIPCGETAARNISAGGTTTDCVVLNSVTVVTGTFTITYGTTECS